MKIDKIIKINILFVCMGNICRSPTAHGVFQTMVDAEGLSETITVDSAGTYDFHIGKQPDSRSMTAASIRGYDLSGLRARQVESSDFEKFDIILAMDDENYSDLLAQCNEVDQSSEVGKDKIKLFLDFASNTKLREVPDPYYSGTDGFETVLDLIEDASRGLLKYIKSTHALLNAPY